MQVSFEVACMESHLTFLVTESGSKFIAHCLDFDLVTCADTFHEAVRRLHFVVAAHSRASEKIGNTGASVHRAPEPYWQRFDELREEHSETVNLPTYSYEVVRTHNAVQ